MELINLKTLAERTSLSVFTLRKYVKKEGLPHFRVGNKIFVNQSEFDEWFEARFRGGMDAPTCDLDAIVAKALSKL